jgi:uncharacterized Rmd1/YagE family protein
MTNPEISARAIQLGERIDLKGLERDDAFSKSPLAFRTGGGGTAVLFKSGTAVFLGMTPLEEEALIDSLAHRLAGPLPVEEREIETARIVVKPGDEELLGPTGALQLRALDDNRLLLVAQALAMSTALAWDERRIGSTFDRIQTVAQGLKEGRLPSGRQSELLRQIGETLSLQHGLAARVDLDDKPDVLWDHPELERFWTKLIEEYDLAQRGRALARKLEVMKETAGTITELMSTRTSHRLEWYIIALILFEVVLGLYDRLWK